MKLTPRTDDDEAGSTAKFEEEINPLQEGKTISGPTLEERITHRHVRQECEQEQAKADSRWRHEVICLSIFLASVILKIVQISTHTIETNYSANGISLSTGVIGMIVGGWTLTLLFVASVICRFVRMPSNIDLLVMYEILKDPSCIVALIFYIILLLLDCVYYYVDLCSVPTTIGLGFALFTIMLGDAVTHESRWFELASLFGLLFPFVLFLIKTTFVNHNAPVIVMNTTLIGTQHIMAHATIRRLCLIQLLSFLIPLCWCVIVDKNRTHMRILHSVRGRHSVIDQTSMDFRLSKQNAIDMFSAAKKEKETLAKLHHKFEKRMKVSKRTSTVVVDTRPSDWTGFSRSTSFGSDVGNTTRDENSKQQRIIFKRQIQRKEIAYTISVCVAFSLYIVMMIWEATSSAVKTGKPASLLFPPWFVWLSVFANLLVVLMLMVRLIQCQKLGCEHSNVNAVIAAQVLRAPTIIYVGILCVLTFLLEAFYGSNNVHVYYTIGFWCGMVTVCFGDAFIQSTRMFDLFNVVLAMSGLVMSILKNTVFAPEFILLTIGTQEYGRNGLIRLIFTQMLTFMLPILLEIVLDSKRINLHVLDKPRFRYELTRASSFAKRRGTLQLQTLSHMSSVSKGLTQKWRPSVDGGGSEEVVKVPTQNSKIQTSNENT